MLPQQIWGEFRLLLRPFLDQYNANSQTTEFHMYEYLPFPPIASYTHWFRLSNHSLISQATPFVDETCKSNRQFTWKNGKLLKERLGRSSFSTLFAVILQVSTCHLCGWAPSLRVRRAMAPNWRYQVTHELGKSGPVETGLTRLANTALIYVNQ